MDDFDSPSSFRMPVAVLLGLVMPPLGVLAWIGLSGSQRRDYLQSNWVRAGISIVVVSAAPLIFIVAAAWLGLWPDPNPNPVGPGLLLVVGGAIGTILTGLGILLVGRS
jgi:hypothetical protein